MKRIEDEFTIDFTYKCPSDGESLLFELSKHDPFQFVLAKPNCPPLIQANFAEAIKDYVYTIKKVKHSADKVLVCKSNYYKDPKMYI